jgi:flagellar motor switch protein FliG
MTNYENLSGLDKAAIIFQVYGESLALSFFTDLPESSIIKIRVRSKELKGIPSDLKKTVLEEFYFKMMTDKYQNNKPSSVRLFDFLDGLNDEQIFYLLKTEKETVMALAIDQVDQSKRNTFLSQLPPDARNVVIRELGSLKTIPLEMVVNIANELEKKASFLPAPKIFSRGGGKKIADILNNMTEDDANSYLTQLMNDDPETYAEVKQYLLTFDDLLSMSDDLAADFWANPDIDLDELAKGLKGVDSDKTTAILEVLPKKKQAMYTPIDTPMKKKDVMASRKNIVKVATDMASAGEIRIEDILSGADDEMIE